MPEKHPGCSSSAMGMQRVHVSSSSWVESACSAAGHVMREGWQIWRPDSWDTDLTRVWLQLQEFHPLTSSDACRRTQLNLPGMVRTKGGVTLAGRGRMHPLCVKLHIRTDELIQFLPPALLEVCQTRLWHVHSVLTDFKHASNTFHESGGAIKYNLRIIWCKLVKTENDATLWKMHFHFIFHRMRTFYCSFAIKWS